MLIIPYKSFELKNNVN